jgi:hypothetical protein
MDAWRELLAGMTSKERHDDADLSSLGIDSLGMLELLAQVETDSGLTSGEANRFYELHPGAVDVRKVADLQLLEDRMSRWASESRPR